MFILVWDDCWNSVLVCWIMDVINFIFLLFCIRGKILWFSVEGDNKKFCLSMIKWFCYVICLVIVCFKNGMKVCVELENVSVGNVVCNLDVCCCVIDVL